MKTFNLFVGIPLIAFLLLNGCATSALNNLFPLEFSTKGLGMGWGIILNQDSTYKYYDYSCLASFESFGEWHFIGDTLTLNSTDLPKIKSIVELNDADSNNVKVLIFGVNQDLYDVDHLYYIKEGELLPFIRESYFEQLKTDSVTYISGYIFTLKRKELLQSSEELVMKIDDHYIKFKIKDPEKTLFKVYLDDSRGIFDLNKKIFFKARKFLLKGDVLYQIYDSEPFIDYDFPAYLNQTN